jgi:hypothetical protein
MLINITTNHDQKGLTDSQDRTEMAATRLLPGSLYYGDVKFRVFFLKKQSSEFFFLKKQSSEFTIHLFGLRKA